MCCSDESDPDDEDNGGCHDCGQPTYDGVAVHGCYYSPVVCDTCGWKPCDGSC